MLKLKINSIPAIIVSVACLSMPMAARANLIFDLAATQVQGPADDAITTITLPSAFTFYGTSYADLKVTSNGQLAFPGNEGAIGGGTYASNTWFNLTAPQVAFFGNDLSTGDRGSHTFFGGLVGTYGGISKIGANSFSNSSYSFSVPNAFVFGNTLGNTQEISLQVSLFTAAQTITLANGDAFTFQAGDIAQSYQNFTNPQPSPFAGSVDLGVANGSGVHADAPGTTNGVLADSASSSLLVPSGSESFYLYRFNSGTSNYNSSLATFTAAVPEPQTWAMLVSGVGLLVGFQRLQRKKRL